MERSIHKSVFGATLMIIFGGCADMTRETMTTGDASVPQGFEAQVAEGADLYAMHCANCHGPLGEGVRGMPALIGIDEGALPLEPAEGSRRSIVFTTVADVAKYTEMFMPPRNAGSLPSEQYWAIIAFSMHENGIDASSTLDPDTAAEIIIPR
jgi:cytochrome c